MKRIVIVGATSAMAVHCARLWVIDQPADMTLVGRSRRRLESVADDLRVRSPKSCIRVVELDFLDGAQIQATVEEIAADGALEIILIAHGALPDQSECQDDLQCCQSALLINAVSPVLFAEAFAKHLERMKCGTMAVIGSVAGDRGRKSNYVYGASKGLVANYVEGLQHRFAATRVKVVLLKPGPTDTPMTAHLKASGARLAPVEDVARNMVAAIARGAPDVYLPSRWRFIMFVIRHLPKFVFNRLEI